MIENQCEKTKTLSTVAASDIQGRFGQLEPHALSQNVQCTFCDRSDLVCSERRWDRSDIKSRIFNMLECLAPVILFPKDKQACSLLNVTCSQPEIEVTETQKRITPNSTPPSSAAQVKPRTWSPPTLGRQNAQHRAGKNNPTPNTSDRNKFIIAPGTQKDQSREGTLGMPTRALCRLHGLRLARHIPRSHRQPDGSPPLQDVARSPTQTKSNKGGQSPCRSPIAPSEIPRPSPHLQSPPNQHRQQDRRTTPCPQAQQFLI
ncbi:hypothetical protein CRENBAI_005937 [Crenichthys baileyi]|uniref:Uncharacterized protein n=1 Tax=Crenichthys baileyi TaxID=28760 RepID=A0AAV9QXY2_9TELE